MKEAVALTKFYEGVKTHMEYASNDDMRRAAGADPVEHELSFQVYRMLTGYSDAIHLLNEIRDALATGNADLTAIRLQIEKITLLGEKK